MTDSLFQLASYARHRSWCPEFAGPGDCTCGLYGLLDSIRCTCGHKVNVHTDRDVSDVVGWPCSECKSERCRGFRTASTEDYPIGNCPECDAPLSSTMGCSHWPTASTEDRT